MKKTILSLIALLGITCMMQAQTKAVSPAKPAKVTIDKTSTATKMNDKKMSTAPVGVKKEVAKPVAKNTEVVEKKTAAVVKSATGPAKKDGTADMRFKANKEKATGPMKKDGTPDKRYKANKP